MRVRFVACHLSPSAVCPYRNTTPDARFSGVGGWFGLMSVRLAIVQTVVAACYARVFVRLYQPDKLCVAHDSAVLHPYRAVGVDDV